IGDVAGHGLQAGLVMMMAQTSLASLIAAQPAASPAELLVTLNRTLYENVKDRMALDRHMTLSVARYCSDGRLIVAGAHLDILHLSADGESPRSIEIPGTWIALLPDIAPVTMDTTIELAPGDLVVLYTDGVIEARDRDGEMFGIDRMCQLICDHRNETPDQLCEHLLTRVHDWVDPEAPREPGRSGCDDDLTVVILRYTGPGGPEAAGDADEPGGAMA
ncbi:MAG: PP2C family protein-serine/threonine phosphatase, partial [Myxococcota bacterium]